MNRLTLTLLLITISLSCFAQTAQDQADSKRLLVTEQLELIKSEALQDESLEKTTQQRVVELIDQAEKWLRQTNKLEGEISQLSRTIEEAPAEIKKLRSSIGPFDTEDESLLSFIKQSELVEIEQRISQQSLDLNQAREQHKEQLATLSDLLVGSQQINSEISEHSDILSKIDAESGNYDEGENKHLNQARQLLLDSRKQLHETQIELLKLRLANQNLLTNLAQAKRDATTAQIGKLETSLQQLNQAASAIREDQAKQARQQAEQINQQLKSLPEPIKTIAQKNAQNRAELEELVYWDKRVSQKLQATQRQLEQISDDFEHSKQRVDVVGASQAIGKMLSRRRQALPSLQSYSRSSAERKQEINIATDRQIAIEEQLLAQSSLTEHVEQVTQPLAEGLSEANADKLRKQVFSLLGARREALNELQKIYGRYITQLTSLDQAERQLLEVSESYVDYINDQLIWISSGDLFDFLDLNQLKTGLTRLLSPQEWLQTGSEVTQAAKQRPGLSMSLLAVLMVIVWKQRNVTLQLPLLAKSTRKIRTDSIRLTLWALLLTLAKIGILPGIMISLGILLKTLPTATPFSLVVATSLVTVGITLTAALLLYQLCLPDGIGIRHLRWNSQICSALTKELRWLIPVAIPLRFIVTLSEGDYLSVDTQNIGRLAIIALMVITLFFVHRLLNKKGLLFQTWQRINPNAILVQLQFLWFPLLLLIGLGIAIAGSIGYLNLSIRLLKLLELTFWFFVGLFILKELLLRYLFIAERRLRYENALQRREELRQQREQEQQQLEDESTVITAEIPEINFDTLSEQAKRLVRFGYLFGSVVGTWLIWSDFLPALDFLTTIQLPFTATQVVDGIVTEGSLTLNDIFIGIIILVFTILAAKNLPGILEITLLQRLPLETGARYALTTLLQYLIAGIGFITAFSTIGFQWSSIQWLVAALGVGLGFGLQEIVANFVSGIILLFERPIRVGDVVTLDDTTGVVSKIRIRATTITNYDKQEMLIPNKEFITGRVINWTLSDKINRIIITVGIAYGSDVKQAMKLMIEAAEENENVLTEPKPVATFEAFGDSALNLLLRVYLGSMDNRLATITALHESINQKFNQAEISIPFPQRDIHIHNPTDK
ncbi:MAG: mechanosensitive ion channel [Candidatus Thiodiazotropha lotti]|uniref:Mechanosensitive ion channel n=1 Tax=Candidatus Thiodiazotropha lotti TaxID=2792787 RepID=A0A9E4K3W8_9GAMM|nr:mechanosensitive ion channel [Candidatus Thiodiazotropha lotti]MCG7922228.1 mechanosensitive ion channel [Candidatus Thiodiazotropha lotti]MCG7931747.1 mechanosensitive ion channel [Candidatus Thiodiazotropha lotti]MCG7939126.1 mechanosensitive ion channel [Candidatus Thiodiazotropha lotti]MCG7986982.1 mechanosensitive ion channel [Candidatus Thiodiazotropha lotti]